MKPALWRLICLNILLLLTLGSPAAAQGPPVKLKSLLIQLWPEFDRAETLVIYRAELAPAVSLPAQVSFQLPEYIDQIFVVAVEQNGKLVEVPAGQYEFKKEGGLPVLTFLTPVPGFQFEYYDPRLLTREDLQRQLQFNITAAYAADKVTLEVQEPAQTESFSMQPAPASTFTSTDGLTYHVHEAANLAAGAPLTLTASYQRQTDALTVPAASSPAEHAADLPLNPVTGPGNQNLNFGYILIGLGVALLLGVLGWWLWSRQSAQPQRVGARRPPRRKAKTAGAAVSAGGFCYNCGASLREESRFCHTCGAERRQP